MIAFLPQKIHAGFPSPAEDYREPSIDLEEYLIHNKPATFLGRVSGDSMAPAGIFAEDIVVIDRSLVPVSGQIIVGRLDDGFVIKYFYKKSGNITLRAADQTLPGIVVNESCDFELWGVVTAVIRKLAIPVISQSV